MPIELNLVNRGQLRRKIQSTLKYLIVCESTNKFVGIIGTYRYLFKVCFFFANIFCSRGKAMAPGAKKVVGPKQCILGHE